MKSLDAIIHNFYKAHASQLGSSRTATHVECQPKVKKPVTATTTPTP